MNWIIWIAGVEMMDGRKDSGAVKRRRDGEEGAVFILAGSGDHMPAEFWARCVVVVCGTAREAARPVVERCM
jgi:hypothetical protein